MPLTILGDGDVRVLLHSLEKKDILQMQQSLADALHYFSSATDEDDNGCGASHQPQRTMLKQKNGATTVFMPATSNDGAGIKIVTLNEASPSYPPTETSSIRSSTKSPVRPGSPSLASLSLSDSSKSNSTRRTSSAGPSSRSSTTAASSVSDGISNKAITTSPAGSLTLLDENGAPRGFINAAEFTAFRTALASTMLFKKRQNVHDVVIFGAGKQAYWHARLALLLRGTEVHHLNIINRNFDNAVQMMRDLFKTPWPVEIPRPQTMVLTPTHTEYDRHLKSTLRAAAVVFCTTPATRPLFPAEIFTNTEGRKKGRYLAAIGSYKPHMCEIHPDILRQAVAPHTGKHYHKHAQQGGAIVVDTVEGCLREAGELIQAGLGGREVVELGELVMLRREAENRRADKETGFDEAGVEIGDQRSKKSKGSATNKHEKVDNSLKDWLERGNVIYKSVGLGLMDVIVGAELVKLADEKGVGVRIENF